MRENLFENLVRVMRPYHQISTSNRIAEVRFGLSLSQFLILVGLRDAPGSTAQGLARKIGIHASSMSLSLQKLHRKKFLTKLKPHQDHRKSFLFLTALGQECLLKYERDMMNLAVPEASLNARSET